MLRDGAPRADGGAGRALYRSPADLDVARFVGEAVVARRRRARAGSSPAPSARSRSAAPRIDGTRPGHDPARADPRIARPDGPTRVPRAHGSSGAPSSAPTRCSRLELADGVGGRSRDARELSSAQAVAGARRRASTLAVDGPGGGVRRRGDGVGVRGPRRDCAACRCSAVAVGCGGQAATAVDRALQRPAPRSSRDALVAASRSRPASTCSVRAERRRRARRPDPAGRAAPRRPTSTSPRTRPSSMTLERARPARASCRPSIARSRFLRRDARPQRHVGRGRAARQQPRLRPVADLAVAASRARSSTSRSRSGRARSRSRRLDSDFPPVVGAVIATRARRRRPSSGSPG